MEAVQAGVEEDTLVKGIAEDKNPFKELKGGCVVCWRGQEEQIRPSQGHSPYLGNIAGSPLANQEETKKQKKRMYISEYI